MLALPKSDKQVWPRAQMSLFVPPRHHQPKRWNCFGKLDNLLDHESAEVGKVRQHGEHVGQDLLWVALGVALRTEGARQRNRGIQGAPRRWTVDV